MNYSIKQVNDQGEWDSFCENHLQGHLLQSWNWGKFKEPDWTPLRLGLYEGGKIVAGVQILVRDFLKQRFFYIPRGPVVDPKNQRAFDALLEGIRQAGRTQRAFAICFEPNLEKVESDELFQNLTKGDFIQPKETLVLDLTKDEGELFNQIQTKARQYIRKAEREGDNFEESKNIDEFVEIMSAIKSRAKITLHPTSYYKRFWNIFSEAEKAYLFFVSKNGTIDAGYLLVGYGQTLYELYGGPKELSSDSKASFLLKWKSIEKAKHFGYKVYDEMGVAPVGDLKDTYSGVTVFKERFGGERVAYPGTYYLVFSPFWYLVWKLAPKIRSGLLKLRGLKR